MRESNGILFAVYLSLVAIAVAYLFIRAHLLAKRIYAKNPFMWGVFNQLMRYGFRRSENFRDIVLSDAEFAEDVERLDRDKIIFAIANAVGLFSFFYAATNHFPWPWPL